MNRWTSSESTPSRHRGTRGRDIGIGLIVALLVLAGTVVSAGPAQAASDTEAAIQQILADTNAVRASAGKAPLVRNSAMEVVAGNWSQAQAGQATMSHNPNFSSQIPAGWSRAGENVAFGYSVTSVVSNWVASAGHYANLIGDYTDIGIGIAHDSSGRPFYTQNFAKYANSRPFGASDIDSKYAAAGSGGGALGAPTSGYLVMAGGGLARAYTSGSIYRTATGSWIVMAGSIRNYYFALAGAAGPLGYPGSDVSALPSGAGSSQVFEGGIVYSTGAGTWYLNGAIRSLYSSGTTAGSVGWPMSGPIPIPFNGGGIGQSFQNGSIYSSAAGAFVVGGAIRNYYFALGGAAGSAGWPSGAASCNSQGVCSQAFTGGTIFVGGNAPARISVQPIENEYARLGGNAGALGEPQSGPLAIAAGGGGYGQVFSGGSIFWSAQSGAFATQGTARDTYFQYGGAAGALRWPTSSANCTLPGQGCVQQFQGGTIYAPKSSSGFVLTPTYEVAYKLVGGPSGLLGWPLGGIGSIASGSGQAYQGGSLYSSTAGTYAVSGGIRTAFFAQGGAVGPFGFPTAASVRSGTGESQLFAAGAIYSNGSGSFGVGAPYNEVYLAAGGPSGVLGWPTSWASCTSGTYCSQSFQGGIIRWTPATGVGRP